MTRLLPRSVPARPALLVVVLGLLASVVTGGQREEPPRTEPAADAPRKAAQEVPRSIPEEDIDISRAVRERREGEKPDLFTARSWAPPPPPPAPPAPRPAAPPAPSAPALPFSYFGHMEDTGTVVVFLTRGGDPINVKVGETIENTYRLEAFNETAITFVYLPLGTRQSLTIPTSAGDSK